MNRNIDTKSGCILFDFNNCYLFVLIQCVFELYHLYDLITFCVCVSIKLNNDLYCSSAECFLSSVDCPSLPLLLFCSQFVFPFLSLQLHVARIVTPTSRIIEADYSDRKIQRRQNDERRQKETVKIK